MSHWFPPVMAWQQFRDRQLTGCGTQLHLGKPAGRKGATCTQDHLHLHPNPLHRQRESRVSGPAGVGCSNGQ